MNKAQTDILDCILIKICIDCTIKCAVSAVDWLKVEWKKENKDFDKLKTLLISMKDYADDAIVFTTDATNPIIAQMLLKAEKKINKYAFEISNFPQIDIFLIEIGKKFNTQALEIKKLNREEKNEN